ncbi:MAG TPA: hypothetical protein PKI77_19580, partial [Mycobacterium sp.]|nr:hypothetical protein [Mycobacterium sp.]
MHRIKPYVLVFDKTGKLVRSFDGDFKTPHGLRIDNRLFVDRVGRRRLGRVRLHAIGVAALRQLDQLDRGRRDVEPYDRSKPALEQHGLSFWFKRLRR